MSSACTIYSSKIDYQSVYETLSRLSPVPLEIIGNIQEWQTIKIIRESTIAFDCIKRKQGEFGEFSRLILGTYAFFQHVDVTDLTRRDRVLDAISNCQFAIGVIASPEFSEEEKHFDMIFEVTKSLDGLIFNGTGMIDETGLLVLDNMGNFDTE